MLEVQIGNEGEEDHQNEDETVKRRAQKRIGARAQDKGAKWGTKKYFL